MLPDDVDRFTRLVGPEPTDRQREMDAHAVEEGFPHVGPEVGGWLTQFARLTDAERVFEFGSGYGYSALWFLRGMADDGEIVLTEFDAEELEMAEEHLSAAGYGDRARFEHGDAMETIERYDGPFDLVLIDHQKHRYADAFHAVREKLSPGAVVVADNAMTAGIIDFETLVAMVAGEDHDEPNEHTAGIYDYLSTVRADPAFETTLLPLGEGLAVSHFRPE